MTHDHEDKKSEEEGFEDEEFVKSKSQIKREAEALQDLGVSISQLTKEQQAKIPLPGNLRQAIEQLPKIKSNGAKRRQAQFIGKLMRGAEIEPIQEAYQEIQDASHRSARQHHLIEQWRDQLIGGDNSKLEQFINDYPHVDRQQLRQLVNGAKKEQAAGKPPAQSRKLFRFIRDILDN